MSEVQEQPKSIMYAFQDDPCPNGGEVIFLFKDNSSRFLTNDEWISYYEENPFKIERAHPGRLRRMFSGRDGELFGLLAERFAALRVNDWRKARRLANLIVLKIVPTTETGRLLKSALVKKEKAEAALKKAVEQTVETDQQEAIAVGA